MTVSMRVMSAGDGYKYLLRTVAVGDGQRSLSTPLTRYYSAKGTPPGGWMGSGLPGLGTRRIVEGAEVTEAQLQRLIGFGRDPVDGVPLGRAYPAYRSPADPAPTDGGQEQPGARRRAVAGYDFTFSIPKSASILWGVADTVTQTRIAEAHHAAVADVVAFMEREVAATRTGVTGHDGAVAQVDVTGLIATAFDHFDSRAGEPHRTALRVDLSRRGVEVQGEADRGRVAFTGRAGAFDEVAVGGGRPAVIDFSRDNIGFTKGRANSTRRCLRKQRTRPSAASCTEVDARANSRAMRNLRWPASTEADHRWSPEALRSSSALNPRG